MAPSLVPVCTMRAYLHSKIADVGPKSSGATRFIANVTEGFIKFNESDIEAQVLPPGGDWPLIDYNANCLYIDARVRAKTEQGEIYLQYKGNVTLDERMNKLLAGDPDAKSMSFGDTTWFTKVDIETTDSRLKWMETAFVVGQGRWNVDEKDISAEYLVYHLKN